MPAPPWFRFYSETLTDRKIDRVCRATNQPKALIIGAWTTLLALANDSPVRGVLLLTEEIPYTLADLADEMGIDPTEVFDILDQFAKFSMIHNDDNGTIYLTNWNGRQFASDNSTERVQRYRAKKKALQTDDSNDDETLQRRSSNAPEQNRAETDTRTDTEAEQTTTDAETDPVAAAVLALKTFGMSQPEKVITETEMSPDEVVDVVRYAKQEKLGAGWVRTQLRHNAYHQPRAPDNRTKYLDGEWSGIVQH